MSQVQDAVVGIIESLLERAGKARVAVTLTTPIHGEGLALDSLDTAELSAILEDEFGTDPFGAGLMPETVGDIVAFYATDAAPGAAAVTA